MKVLMVITHGNIGGATNVVIDLAQGLKSRGVDVAVGFSEGEYLSKKLIESGIPRFKFKNIKRSSNPLSALAFIFEIKNLAKKERFDVVQFNSSNSLPGVLGVKLADKKIKTIFTVHGLSVLDKNYQSFFLLKYAYRLFFRFFLSFVDVPVFVSTSNLEEAKKMKLVEGGEVIYNGLDESELKFILRNEARGIIGKKMNLDLNDKFVVGSIGRLSYQKNYEFLIKSFGELLAIKSNALAIIIGDGPKKPEHESLIKKLGLADKVFLFGGLSDASAYLKAFDLFVLPSRYEGLPVTLEECLFASVPVLASAVGGNGEIANESRSISSMTKPILSIKSPNFSVTQKVMSAMVPKKNCLPLRKCQRTT